VRNLGTIDGELRLLAAVRQSIASKAASRQVDELLDERGAGTEK
jgi:hypothetical protein